MLHVKENLSAGFLSGATIIRNRNEEGDAVIEKNRSLYVFAGDLLQSYGHEKVVSDTGRSSDKTRITPVVCLDIGKQNFQLMLQQFRGSFKDVMRLHVMYQGQTTRAVFEMRGEFGTLFNEDTKLKKAELDLLGKVLERMETALQKTTNDGQLKFSSKTF